MEKNSLALEKGYIKYPKWVALLAFHERRKVLASCQHQHYDTKEQIIAEHQVNSDIYFILSGCVRVVVYSRKGRALNFIDLSPGQSFGELSAIDGKPRSAAVVAREPSELLVMPKAVFLALLEDNSQVAISVLQELAAIIRRLGERLYALSMLDANSRIFIELLNIVENHGRYAGFSQDKLVIDPFPSGEEIASRVSCTREAVSRIISVLAKQNLLTRQGKVIIIPALKKFKGFCLSEIRAV